jgi:hypothetical protein
MVGLGLVFWICIKRWIRVRVLEMDRMVAIAAFGVSSISVGWMSIEGQD